MAPPAVKLLGGFGIGLLFCSCTIYQSPIPPSPVKENDCAPIETKIDLGFSPPEGSTLRLNDPFYFVADGFRANKLWYTGWVFIRDDDHEFINREQHGNYSTCALPSEIYNDAMVELNTFYSFLRAHVLKGVRFVRETPPLLDPIAAMNVPNAATIKYQTDSAPINWKVE